MCCLQTERKRARARARAAERVFSRQSQGAGRMSFPSLEQNEEPDGKKNRRRRREKEKTSFSCVSTFDSGPVQTPSLDASFTVAAVASHSELCGVIQRSVAIKSMAKSGCTPAGTQPHQECHGPELDSPRWSAIGKSHDRQ